MYTKGFIDAELETGDSGQGQKEQKERNSNLNFRRLFLVASVLPGMKHDLRDEIIGPETSGSPILSHGPSEPIDERKEKIQ